MIFAGDVAIAHGDRFVFAGFPPECRKTPWCVNLEGAIAESGEMPDWGTSNSPDWQDSFSGFVLAPVFLANNHIHDMADGIKLTRSSLMKAGLDSFGAGADAAIAAEPAIFESNGHNYLMLGFGWPVIGCVPAKRHRPGVNRVDGPSVLQQVAVAVSDFPGSRVVVVIHGNYEFERYPQPGHRKLAMKMIDLGVHAVVGHHPHIVGPVERYKGKTIAYSLGNWAFSYGRFFGGRLCFPEASFHQIALELGDAGDTIHHVRFSPPTTVTYLVSEPIDSAGFSLKAPFEGFGDQQYLNWFKANRIKRRGLPIYRDGGRAISNRVRDAWVRTRQFGIDSAAKLGFKSMRPGRT